MIDALSLDCIRTARAKGLSEKAVVYSHAWRNALVPMVSIIVGVPAAYALARYNFARKEELAFQILVNFFCLQS